MTMALTQLTIGDASFRAGRWRGRADLATLVPLTGAPTLDSKTLGAARESLQSQGFQAVVTAAVGPPERAAFEEDRFCEREQLHLLRYDLQPRFVPHSTFGRNRRPRQRRRPAIRRGTTRDWDEILTLDAQSFDEFWRFDQDGLEDSIQATPTSRLRIIRERSSDELVGYALVGHSGGSGYLQRLAVRPNRRRQGIATLLVDDALAWTRRRGAAVGWVNTQTSNDNALRLYQKLGFTLQDHRLTVMYRKLT